MNPLLCALVCSVFVFSSSLDAESDDGGAKYFRSEAGLGHEPGRLPERLDSPAALRWRVKMDSGHSTPLVWKDKIFLTTFRSGAAELAVVALDRVHGQLLWRRAVPAAKIERTHAIGSPATATPACDGQRLYVFFGSFGLICYDLEGGKLWEHPLGPFQDEFGAGSSPIVVDGKVILNQDHDIDSFLIALDGATGRTVWKADRPDAVRSYSTPVLWNRNGRQEVLVAGALELASYAPETGQKLWWTYGLARIVIPTPVPSGDTIYVASWTPGGDPGQRVTLDRWTIALEKWDKNQDSQLTQAEVDNPDVLDRFFRMDRNQDDRLDQKEWERHAEVFRRAQNALLAIKPRTAGELPAKDTLWKYTRGIPYVATPLLDQGRLWMVKEGGIVTVLEAGNGRLLMQERLPGPGNYFSSPAAADGKIFFASENGVVSIVANRPEWRVISSHNFQEKIYATPVLERGQVFIRTDQSLSCFQGGKD